MRSLLHNKTFAENDGGLNNIMGDNFGRDIRITSQFECRHCHHLIYTSQYLTRVNKYGQTKQIPLDRLPDGSYAGHECEVKNKAWQVQRKSWKPGDTSNADVVNHKPKLILGGEQEKLQQRADAIRESYLKYGHGSTVFNADTVDVVGPEPIKIVTADKDYYTEQKCYYDNNFQVATTFSDIPRKLCIDCLNNYLKISIGVHHGGLRV